MKVDCRICGRGFLRTGAVYERVIDHIESRHPALALTFREEIAELRRQEAEAAESAKAKPAGRVAAGRL